MNDPSEYINLIVEYRNQRGLPTPTKEEVQEWTDAWASWNKKRRQREIDKMRAHLVISRLNLTKR